MRNCEWDKNDTGAVCETDYLLQSPENQRKLLQAFIEAKQNIGKKITLKKTSEDT